MPRAGPRIYPRSREREGPPECWLPDRRRRSWSLGRSLASISDRRAPRFGGPSVCPVEADVESHLLACRPPLTDTRLASDSQNLCIRGGRTRCTHNRALPLTVHHASGLLRHNEYHRNGVCQQDVRPNSYLIQFCGKIVILHLRSKLKPGASLPESSHDLFMKGWLACVRLKDQIPQMRCRSTFIRRQMLLILQVLVWYHVMSAFRTQCWDQAGLSTCWGSDIDSASVLVAGALVVQETLGC